MVTKGNLSVVDNRYSRAGVFVLLSPSMAWRPRRISSCSTPSNSGPARTPSPASRPPWWIRRAMRSSKVNQHLDPALNQVPLACCPKGVREVQVSYPDERTAQMEIHYIDGQRSLMRGEMRGERLDLYLDDKLVSTLSREQRDAAASRERCRHNLSRPDPLLPTNAIHACGQVRPDVEEWAMTVNGLRLAELIGSLSHALDMTEGQPRGHCIRCCWIGSRLGSSWDWMPGSARPLLHPVAQGSGVQQQCRPHLRALSHRRSSLQARLQAGGWLPLRGGQLRAGPHRLAGGSAGPFSQPVPHLSQRGSDSQRADPDPLPPGRTSPASCVSATRWPRGIPPG